MVLHEDLHVIERGQLLIERMSQQLRPIWLDGDLNFAVQLVHVCFNGYAIVANLSNFANPLGLPLCVKNVPLQRTFWQPAGGAGCQ
jgi:hypothetical protein